MGATKEVPTVDKQAIAQKYNDGATLQQLAEQYHFSTTKIRTILIGQGVTIRRQSDDRNSYIPTPEEIAAETKRLRDRAVNAAIGKPRIEGYVPRQSIREDRVIPTNMTRRVH